MTDAEETTSGGLRGPSRSAQLVAACRALAAELPESERLISDPFAAGFVDDEAMEAARANEPLQRVIRLRTRVIDDGIREFATRASASQAGPQILLLGAGVDARALRLDLAARFFEVDLPATLAHKQAVIDQLGLELPSRIAVPVDLGEKPPREPLVKAGFDPQQPAFVVWEGVINYLDDAAAAATVRDLGDLLAPGSRVIADYVENRSYDAEARSRTKAVAGALRTGGEPLKAGLLDFTGTFERAGFRVVADDAIEELAERYGLEARPRFYPARIATLERV